MRLACFLSHYETDLSHNEILKSRNETILSHFEEKDYIIYCFAKIYACRIIIV